MVELGRRQLAGALALTAVAFAIPSCGDDPDGEPAGPLVLATVGDRAISFEEFSQSARARTAPGEFPRTGSGFEAVRDRLLMDIATIELLTIEAEVRDIALDPAVVEHELLLAAEGVQDEERLPEILQERYGSVEAYRTILERRLLGERVEGAVRAELAAAVAISEEDVVAARARFDDSLTRPPRLRARQVFATDPERIRAVWQELAEGAPFVALAGKYNDTDGDMGWMTTAEAPPVLVEATAELAPGEYTEVIHSALGYHIFELVGREPAVAMPREAADGRIAELLLGEATDVAFAEWLAGRTENHHVTIVEDAVAQVRCCRRGLPYADQPSAEEP